MISPKNFLLGAMVSAVAVFAVAVPASAAPAAVAPDTCVSAKQQLFQDQNTLDQLKQADATSDGNVTGAKDVGGPDAKDRAVDDQQSKVNTDQLYVNGLCNGAPAPPPRPVPDPQPIVTIGGNYPVPANQTEREHLIQVCIANNQGLLTTISASVLAKDCRDTVPRCPVIPPPCHTCPTATTPPPTTVVTPPPTVIVPAPTTITEVPPQPVVVPGPTTIIQQPTQIVQAPSGTGVSTGSVNPADRYVG